MIWSPWPTRERPTADTINDDDLDDLLTRLERAESLSRILTRRAYPTTVERAEDLKNELFLSFRTVLHHQHHTEGLSKRPEVRCHTCNRRAHHLVWVWEGTQEWAESASQSRYREIQDRIDHASSTGWGTPESAWRAREDVPWLLSQVRLAQRSVRRLEGLLNREAKEERRHDQSHRDLQAHNRRLAEEIKQLKIFKSPKEL